ncbi:MAG: hypothetical protein QXD05_01050 [Candidatus Pacearchaeota archaeon]
MEKEATNYNENPNWKQWIPIYGVYRAMTDRTSLADNMLNHPIRTSIYTSYQALFFFY